MLKYRNWFKIVVLLTVGAILAGGCSSSASTTSSKSSSSKTPIVLGLTSSETGAFAVDATYALDDYKYAVAQVNAHGGWLGHKLVLKIYNDNSSAGTVVSLYTKLITQDHVNFLLGPYSSDITQAIAPLVNKYKYVTLEPESSMTALSVPGNTWNIMGIVKSSDYLKALLPLAKKYGYKTVAIMALISAFSLECGQTRKAQAKSLGMQVTYYTTYNLPSPNYTAMALAAEHSGAQVVIGCTYYPDAVGILQTLAHVGYKPKMVGETVGPVEKTFAPAVGSLVNGLITNTSWWPTLNTPGNKAFVSGFKKMFGFLPDYHAASNYSAIEVLGQAIEDAHSLSQSAVLHEIMTHTFQTVQGPFKVGQYGKELTLKSYLVQYQNGNLTLCTPRVLPRFLFSLPIQVDDRSD